MTPTAEILAACRDLGVEVIADGDGLVLRRPGGVPRALAERVAHYKQHIIFVLTPLVRCLDCRHATLHAGPDGLAHCLAGHRGVCAGALHRCGSFAARVPS